MEDGEKTCSLTDKYKIKSDDEDSKDWARLLDFESPIKVESDWYSTQTFQMFLDALDINQPTTSTSDGKKPISNGTGSVGGGTLDKTKKPATRNESNDKQPPVQNKQERDKMPSAVKHDKTKYQQQNNFETILSAEALKILSDLPDLSHMSATRSFIFPATAPASVPARNSQRTRINSSKR